MRVGPLYEKKKIQDIGVSTNDVSSPTKNQYEKRMSKQQVPPEERYVYNVSHKVLDSLQLMYFDSATIQEITSPSSPSSLPTETVQVAKKQTEQIPEQVHTFNDLQYYKSDLYRLNIKRESRGLPRLSEQEFQQLADELDNESISGSEEDGDFSEVDESYSSRKKDTLETIFEKSIHKLEALNDKDDDESVVSHLATRSPFILFKSTLLDDSKAFAIYKSLFTIKELESPLEAIKKWQTASLESKSALFMIGGGHFAAAIINHKPKSIKGNIVKPGENPLVHSVDVALQKSFHRYTTRRKQGGAQSASDNAHGKANSAGSSLRRANEAALQNEVRELLRNWKSELDGCESIFIRANGSSNRNIIVGYEGSPLKNDDVRIKSFPFTTKRATNTELKRAWIQLAYLSIVDRPKIDDKKLKQRQLQEQLKHSTLQKITKEQGQEDEVTEEEKHTKELVSFLKKSRGPVLITYLKKHKLSGNFILQPQSEYYHTPTLLHYASANGIKNLISVLIKTAKVDPTIKNPNGRTAYEIAANKATRLAFRIARYDLGESFTDWQNARVDEPISKEAIEKEEQEEKEKEEQLKKELIQRELAKVEINPLPKPGSAHKLGGGLSSSQNNISSLSEEQRLRLMREQRARAAEARMKALQK